MRRMRALALAALACAALALLPAATAASSPYASALVPVQEVYADRLVAATHYTVTGYIAMEHFAPLKATDITLSLTVAGVQRRVTRPLPDNSWAFKDVPPGTHVLEVVADGFEVPAVRVDVSDETGRVRFARADAPTRPLRAPLVLGPVARVTYEDKKQEFTLRSLLKNPFYVMMGLMAVMMFIMPRMMENMDPEELKAMQEQMGKGGTMSLLQGVLNGEEPSQVAKKKNPSPAGGAGGGAGSSSGGGGGSAKKKTG